MPNSFMPAPPTISFDPIHTRAVPRDEAHQVLAEHGAGLPELADLFANVRRFLAAARQGEEKHRDEGEQQQAAFDPRQRAIRAQHEYRDRAQHQHQLQRAQRAPAHQQRGCERGSTEGEADVGDIAADGIAEREFALAVVDGHQVHRQLRQRGGEGNQHQAGGERRESQPLRQSRGALDDRITAQRQQHQTSKNKPMAVSIALPPEGLRRSYGLWRERACRGRYCRGRMSRWCAISHSLPRSRPAVACPAATR
jgi:hypothetical protein